MSFTMSSTKRLACAVSLALVFAAASLAVVSLGPAALAQNPVFPTPRNHTPRIDIDQKKLLVGCVDALSLHCGYSLREVLNSGGDFWTTPFQPFDPVTGVGDGYGEGASGPRADQRHAFNPNTHNASYRFLRLNGLDSQSCFECHNSIGSAAVQDSKDLRGAVIRKTPGTSGSAGSNSNAFINPLFPMPTTLFIRNPPAVFGSGYQQALAAEMTMELQLMRMAAHELAKRTPGTPVTVPLSSKGVDFGTFSTTFTGAGTPSVVNLGAAADTCPVAATKPLAIGGMDGFSDDMSKVAGVSCDLVIRPFQWKGVTSNLRHFVRDALDFHFSMQAFEKVGLCDCDLDGKGTTLNLKDPRRSEVTIGEVTALVSFVAMTRPPVQDYTGVDRASAKRGEVAFSTVGCASCHMKNLHLLKPVVSVEWPLNPAYQKTSATQADYVYVNPRRNETWPIPRSQCKEGEPLVSCPVESSYSAATGKSTVDPRNLGGLVSPLAASDNLAVVHRFKTNFTPDMMTSIMATAPADMPLLKAKLVQKLRAPLPVEAGKEPDADLPDMSFFAEQLGAKTAEAKNVLGMDYTIPLSYTALQAEADLTPLQRPRLPGAPDAALDVPILSDLKRHNMGKCLADPDSPLPSQGTDVIGVVTAQQEYLTRPIWGVADTGPWLHDGRAMTLMEAILMHGDSATCSDSEAAPTIDKFKALPTDQDRADIVNFLLTLRLPTPDNKPSPPSPHKITLASK